MMTAIQPPPQGLRSSEPVADVKEFFNAVEDALTEFMKTPDNIPDGTRPVYAHSFPKERLAKTDQPFDLITFHVFEGGMSPTSNDGARTPRDPAVREKRAHPNLAGYNLITTGWWEDVAVVFTVWSKSNLTADNLAVWFHKFLMRYACYYKFFLSRGVSQFRFVKRLEDDVDQQEGQELFRRRFIYSFRIEYLDSFMERQLTNISVNIAGVQTAAIPTQK